MTLVQILAIVQLLIAFNVPHKQVEAVQAILQNSTSLSQTEVTKDLSEPTPSIGGMGTTSLTNECTGEEIVAVPTQSFSDMSLFINGMNYCQKKATADYVRRLLKTDVGNVRLEKELQFLTQ